jgi:hypothetical protein
VIIGQEIILISMLLAFSGSRAIQLQMACMLGLVGKGVVYVWCRMFSKLGLDC